MKREFLTELGLEKDQVEKIMAEHGKTVTAIKDTVTALETEKASLEGQIATRDDDIEKLKKANTGNEDLQKELDGWKDKYEKETEAFQQEVTQTKLNSAVDMALVQAKARNTTAVRALLDLDTIKVTDEGVQGLKEQLEKVQSENAYLFETEPAPGSPRFTTGQQGRGAGDVQTDAFKAAVEKII